MSPNEHFLFATSGRIKILRLSHYDYFYYTEAKVCFANTCENTTKKRLFQVKKEKLEINLELANTRLRVGFESAT